MATSTETFSFQIDVEALPYNPKTVKCFFGEGVKHDPSIPENWEAWEFVGEMVKDAICHVLESQSNFICQNKIEDTDKLEGRNKEFWDWLEGKVDRYRKIEKTIKPMVNNE